MAKAAYRRAVPIRSPNAVRYGIAFVSGSCFWYQKNRTKIWAMYRSKATCVDTKQ